MVCDSILCFFLLKLSLCLTDNVVSQAEKLPILRDIFPHVDDQTLAYYLDVYNSNVDAIISELINQT